MEKPSSLLSDFTNSELQLRQAQSRAEAARSKWNNKVQWIKREFEILAREKNLWCIAQNGYVTLEASRKNGVMIYIHLPGVNHHRFSDETEFNFGYRVKGLVGRTPHFDLKEERSFLVDTPVTEIFEEAYRLLMLLSFEV